MEQDRLKRAWLIGELGLVLIFILLFILALKDVIKLQNNHTVDVYLHLKLHYMITYLSKSSILGQNESVV